METFKITLRSVFATAAVLNALVAILNFFRGPAASIGIFLFYVNLINIPLFIAFILVLLYNCLFKRKPVSFFKNELIYLLMQIGAIVLLELSYINCPTCPG
jgi:hypothetical protein